MNTPSESPTRPNTNVRALPRWLPGTVNALYRLAPGVAGRVYLEAFLRPPRVAAPERERRWLDDTEPREWSAAGRQVVGFSRGEGPAVLLVHGWAGRGSQLGAFIEPLVKRGYRVVGVDLPGHGHSPGSRSSIPECAWAVEAVLRDLGDVDAVVAHSMGGAAVTAAMRATGGEISPVERLVLIGVADDVGALTRRITTTMGFDPGVYDQFQRLAERRFEVDFDDYVLSRDREPARRVLGLHADDDREVNLEEARAWADVWPRARFELRSGLGHTRILRQPEIVDRVVEFVAGERASSAA